MTTPPLVYIVDDEPGVRDALITLLDSVSLPSRAYASAEKLLQELRPEQPGCLIVDLRMPGLSGLELQEQLQQRHCEQPIIFLTGHGKVRAAVRAMQAGAVEFLTKPVDDDMLLDTVRAALQQDRAQREERSYNAQMSARLNTLTQRELQTLINVTRGLSNKEIARELEISHKTVELHRAHMMDKMQAHSIAEVVQMYLLAQTETNGTRSEEEE